MSSESLSGVFSQLWRAMASDDEMARNYLSIIRARRHAARPGAPNRAAALRSLNEVVVDLNQSALPRLRNPNANIRGTTLITLEQEHDAATRLLVDAGMSPRTTARTGVFDFGKSGRTSSGGDARRLIQRMERRVSELEQSIRTADAELDRYNRGRRRGTVAGHEDAAYDRRAADSVSRAIMYMRQAKSNLENAMRSQGNSHAGWPASQRTQMSRLLSRGRSAEGRAASTFSVWRGFTASRFDTRNLTASERRSRTRRLVALRDAHRHGDVQRRISEEGVPWWVWALGSVTVLSLLYFGTKVLIFSAKRSPQGMALSAVAGRGE